MLNIFKVTLGDKLKVKLQKTKFRQSPSIRTGFVELVSKRGVNVRIADNEVHFVKWENVLHGYNKNQSKSK